MDKPQAIEHLRDLFDVVDWATENLGFEVWWRGQPAGKTLTPGVFRLPNPIAFEANAIIRFKSRAPSRHANCPGANDAAEWLFLMQHYRLPTRLLDWTSSPLIALYFAVSPRWNNTRGPASLWVLNPFELNRSSISRAEVVSPEHKSARQLFFDAGSGKHDPRDTVLAVACIENDRRMLLQQSQFTIHGSPKPMEALAERDCYLLEFSVLEPARLNLYKALFKVGVTESALFPDLEHLAIELRERRFKSED